MRLTRVAKTPAKWFLSSGGFSFAYCVKNARYLRSNQAAARGNGSLLSFGCTIRGMGIFPDYQPKPDDVFHAVGYTNQDILAGAQMRLLNLSSRVMTENGKLLQQFGPLVPAIQSAKAKREFIEVLSVDPFTGDGEMPYAGPNNGAFMVIEYLSDGALRLCREFGIQLPPVIEKLKRADIPETHGITLRTIYYSRI